MHKESLRNQQVDSTENFSAVLTAMIRLTDLTSDKTKLQEEDHRVKFYRSIELIEKQCIAFLYRRMNPKGSSDITLAQFSRYINKAIRPNDITDYSNIAHSAKFTVALFNYLVTLSAKDLEIQISSLPRLFSCFDACQQGPARRELKTILALLQQPQPVAEDANLYQLYLSILDPLQARTHAQAFAALKQLATCVSQSKSSVFARVTQFMLRIYLSTLAEDKQLLAGSKNKPQSAIEHLELIALLYQQGLITEATCFKMISPMLNVFCPAPADKYDAFMLLDPSKPVHSALYAYFSKKLEDIGWLENIDATKLGKYIEKCSLFSTNKATLLHNLCIKASAPAFIIKYIEINENENESIALLAEYLTNKQVDFKTAILKKVADVIQPNKMIDAVTDSQAIEASKLNALLFYLTYTNLEDIDLQKIEKWTKTHLQGLLNSTLTAAQQESCNALYRIEEWVSEKIRQKISDCVDACAMALRSQMQNNTVTEEEIARFSSFYQSDADNNPTLVTRKKAFILLMLQQLRLRKIKGEKISDVAGLIEEYNKSGTDNIKKMLEEVAEFSKITVKNYENSIRVAEHMVKACHDNDSVQLQQHLAEVIIAIGEMVNDLVSSNKPDFDKDVAVIFDKFIGLIKIVLMNTLITSIGIQNKLDPVVKKLRQIGDENHGKFASHLSDKIDQFQSLCAASLYSVYLYNDISTLQTGVTAHHHKLSQELKAFDNLKLCQSRNLNRALTILSYPVAQKSKCELADKLIADIKSGRHDNVDMLIRSYINPNDPNTKQDLASLSMNNQADYYNLAYQLLFEENSLDSLMNIAEAFHDKKLYAINNPYIANLRQYTVDALLAASIEEFEEKQPHHLYKIANLTILNANNTTNLFVWLTNLIKVARGEIDYEQAYQQIAQYEQWDVKKGLFNELLCSYLTADSNSKSIAKLSQAILLLEFNPQPESELHSYIGQLKEKLALKINAEDLELGKLYLTLLAKNCLYTIHKKFDYLDPIALRLATLVKNLCSSDALTAGQVDRNAQLMRIIINCVSVTGPSHFAITNLFSNLDEEMRNSLLANLFDATEQAYAKKLVMQDLFDIINDAKPYEYLAAIKWTYWQTQIIDKLLTNHKKSFLDKFEQHAQFHEIKRSLDKLLYADNLVLLRRAYDDLLIMLNEPNAEQLAQPFYDIIYQLITTNAIAHIEGHDAIWVELLDALTECHATLDLEAIKLIIMLVTWFIDPKDAVKIVKNNHESPYLLSEYFYQLIKCLLQINANPDLQAEVKLTNKLLSPGLTTQNGLKLLYLLTSELKKSLDLNPNSINLQDFNNIVELVMEAGVHINPSLLNSLGKLPMKNWRPVLKRAILANRLGVLASDHMIDDLLTLRKSYGEDTFERLVNTIITKKASVKNRDELGKILEKTACNEWHLDDELLKMLEEKDFSEWQTTLLAKQPKSDDQDLSLPQLVEAMQANEKIFPSVLGKLLSAKSNNSSQAKTKLEIIINSSRETRKLYQECSPNEFKEKMATELRNLGSNSSDFLMKNGKIDKDKLAQYFAILLEAVYRETGKSLRDTQLIALIGFIYGFQTTTGRIANISTGEGKSLIAIAFAITCVLRNERVDICTSSSALAVPQAESAKRLCLYFGIGVDNNCDSQCENDEVLRRRRYAENHIIFGDVGSFQRDILLDDFFDKKLRSEKSNRLIVDEVDSAFIDNADKVLYLSHGIADLSALRFVLEFIWSCVYGKGTEKQSVHNTQLIIELYHQQIAKGTLAIPPFLTEFVNRRLPLWVNSAYIAKNIEVDTSYSVMTEGTHRNKPVINDLPTGVEQFQSQWSNGLHQFIQLKHRKELTDETLRAVFISNLSYFNRYRETGRLNGMSGTLGGKAERELMAETYQTESFNVPRFRKSQLRQERGCIEADIVSWRKAVKKDTLEKVSRNASITLNQEEAAKGYDLAVKNLEKLAEDFEQDQLNLSAIHTQILANERQLELLKEENKHLSCMVEMSLEDKAESVAKNNDKIVNITASIQSYYQQATLLQERMALSPAKRQEEQIKKENYQAVKDGKSGRAVLIICEDKKLAKELANKFTKHFKKHPSAHKLYSYISNTNKFKLDTEKVQPGDIIIATNIAGRGTDLEVSEQLSNNGGLHVILTSIPENRRIEEQAKGRSGRNGHPGSCKFIVCDSRNSKENPVSIELLLDIRDELENNRLQQIQRNKFPRLEAEEKLLNQFSTLQQEVNQYLKSHHYDEGTISIQLKSLQDRWAFWFDKQDEMLNQVCEVGMGPIQEEFDTFKNIIWDILKQPGSDKLIFEPSEWFRLAKHCAYNKNYAAAFDYYHKAIENNKDFSGFYHYYLAQAYILASKTDYKDRARNHLQLAEKQFQKQIQRLSTSSQIAELIKQYTMSTGEGIAADLHMKTNSDEIGIYNIHIQACRDAMGSLLTPELFQHGEFVNTKEDEVLSLVKNLLPSTIKDTRVSRKAKIVTDPNSKWSDLYYKEQLVKIPTDYFYCRDQIIDSLRKLTSDGPLPHDKRKIDYHELEKNILTQQRFLQYIEKLVTTQDVIILAEDISNKIKGGEVFKDYPNNIQALLKQELLTAKSGMSSELFRDTLAKKLTNTDMNEVIKALEARNLIKIAPVKVFTQQAFAEIKAYTREITLDDNLTNADIDKIPLEKYPGLCHYATSIREILHSTLSSTPRTVTMAQFQDSFGDKTDDLFRALFYTLKDSEFTQNNLVSKLQLNLHMDRLFHPDLVEYQILNCYEKGGDIKSEFLNLPEKASQSVDMLMRHLADQGFVKMPSVFFACKTTANESAIKQTLADIRMELWQAVLIEKITQKQADAIYEILEKSIGTLRTIPRVELKNFNLEEYFRGAKLPPVVAKHMLNHLGDVLHLIEAIDKKNTNWDAFLCAMLGVVQIVVGALISYCVPAAAYFGQMLISEGIGDIIFAITASINGGFSWEAYGDHKAQSVALSILTMGVEMALTQGKAVVQAAEAAKKANKSISIAKRVGAELLKAAVQIAASVSVNLIMANLGQEVISAVINDFKKDFKNKCKGKMQQNGLVDHLKALYRKLGAAEGDLVMNLVLKDLNLDQRCNAFIAKDAHKAAESVANSIAKVKLNNSNTASSNSVVSSLKTAQKVINVAKVVADILHATSYINSIADVIKSTEKLFAEAQKAFKDKADTVLQKNLQNPLTEEELASRADKKADEVLEIILNKIELKVVNILQRGGSELFNLAINPMVESAQQFIENGVQQLAAKNRELLSTTAEVITTAAPPKDKEASIVSAQQTVETLSYEELQAAGIDAIVTEQGILQLSEIDPNDRANYVFRKVDDTILMLPASFSGLTGTNSGGNFDGLPASELVPSKIKYKFKHEKKQVNESIKEDKIPADLQKKLTKNSNKNAKLRQALAEYQHQHQADHQKLQELKGKQDRASVHKRIQERLAKMEATKQALRQTSKKGAKLAQVTKAAKSAVTNTLSEISKSLGAEKSWEFKSKPKEVIPETAVMNHPKLGQLSVGLTGEFGIAVAVQASLDHKKVMKAEGSLALKGKIKYLDYQSPEAKFTAELKSSAAVQIKGGINGKSELVIEIKPIELAINPFTDGISLGPLTCHLEVATGVGVSYDPKSMIGILEGDGTKWQKAAKAIKGTKMGFFIEANPQCTIDKSKVKPPVEQHPNPNKWDWSK